MKIKDNISWCNFYGILSLAPAFCWFFVLIITIGPTIIIPRQILTYTLLAELWPLACITHSFSYTTYGWFFGTTCEEIIL